MRNLRVTNGLRGAMPRMILWSACAWSALAMLPGACHSPEATRPQGSAGLVHAGPQPAQRGLPTPSDAEVLAAATRVLKSAGFLPSRMELTIDKDKEKWSRFLRDNDGLVRLRSTETGRRIAKTEYVVVYYARRKPVDDKPGVVSCVHDGGGFIALSASDLSQAVLVH